MGEDIAVAEKIISSEYHEKSIFHHPDEALEDGEIGFDDVRDSYLRLQHAKLIQEIEIVFDSAIQIVMTESRHQRTALWKMVKGSSPNHEYFLSKS